MTFLLSLIVFVASTSAVAFWLWTLIECLNEKNSVVSGKFLWLFILVFFTLPGAIAYYFIRRPQAIGSTA